MCGDRLTQIHSLDDVVLTFVASPTKTMETSQRSFIVNLLITTHMLVHLVPKKHCVAMQLQKLY